MKRSRSVTNAQDVLGASFRDPAGFVFTGADGRLFRQIDTPGRSDYDLLMRSGLYDVLSRNGHMVEHTEIERTAERIVIEPAYVPFITYPFEWSFSQLQDAALLTLSIQKLALAHGMTLKDASAYNVQFVRGKPMFIDTLSFEKYTPGEPWQAYRQFCQHFLAPLVLMAHTDIRLGQLLGVHLDGIPLDLTAKLLPRRARMRPGIALHIVLHGQAQKAKESDAKRPGGQLSQAGMIGIIESLQRTVRKLTPRAAQTEWADYYDKTNYPSAAATHKSKVVCEYLKPLHIETALDFGGNDGRYSRALNALGIATVCADIDPVATEANYRQVKQAKEELMLPMVVNLVNPTGAIGWANDERPPIHDRLRVDAVVALALLHHLAITNNVPFDRIARYFCTFAPYLVLEFAPKTDSQVQKLLATRKDIFAGYNEDSLLQAFGAYYTLLKKTKVKGTKRTLYLFKRKKTT